MLVLTNAPLVRVFCREVFAKHSGQTRYANIDLGKICSGKLCLTSRLGHVNSLAIA